MQIFKTKKTFKKEFKRQVRFAIDAAIGFTIAYAWRESIFSTFNNFVARFFDLTKDHYSTELYTSITITIFGVALIFFTSKILKE